mgnify:CR=1 FL=1
MDNLPPNASPVNENVSNCSSENKKPVSEKNPPALKEMEPSKKKLEEYRQSRPEQIALFELKKAEEKPYSNLIEFYDAIPKYLWVKQTKKENLRLLQRNFVHKGIEYEVLIQPATIKDKNGNLKTCFPGEREELVEDALRKLACEGNAVFLDDSAGVLFTLYEIEQELKRMGHSHNKNEIKEAIMICNQTHLKVETKDRKVIVGANIFVAVGLQTQENWKGHGKKTEAFIIFNPLVTKSIKEKTFRLLNYDKSMSYKRTLARWFHKRLSHNYIQAAENSPYSIKVSTIIRDSGMKQYKNLRDNIYQVKLALEEMKEKEVIEKYEVSTILEGRKIVEAKFEIIPHPSFIAEVKFANKQYYLLKPEERKREIDHYLKTMKDNLFLK